MAARKKKAKRKAAKRKVTRRRVAKRKPARRKKAAKRKPARRKKAAKRKPARRKKAAKRKPARRKKAKSKRKPSAAFMKPVTPSAALAEVVGAKPQADRFQLSLGALKRIVAGGKFQGHGDVFQRRHGRDQMEILKHDADIVAAKQRQSVFV